MSRGQQYPGEVVYTPESQLRHPRRLIQRMGQDLLASRDLAWRLMIRDISSQYRQSLFGIIWAFLPPIATAIGLTLANQANILNIAETPLPYAAYVMFSMSLWQTFVEAVNGPIQVVTASKTLLAKINFPHEALILSRLGQLGFNFGIKLILIIALFLWFKIPVTWTVLLAPVALLHLVALGTALGLLLAPLGTLYNDVARGLTFVTAAWLLITPVVYPPPQEGLFSVLVNLNPVTPLLVTTRELAAEGGVLSDPAGFWMASAIAFIGLLLSWLVFRVAMPFVIERMSA